MMIFVTNLLLNAARHSKRPTRREPAAPVYMIEMALVELDTNLNLPRKKSSGGPVSYGRRRPIGR